MTLPGTTSTATTARRSLLFRFLAVTLPVVLSLSCVAQASAAARSGDDSLDGYVNYRTLQKQIKKLTKQDLATARSLGKTLEGRHVILITIGTGEVNTKPAIVMIGNVDAGHLVGTEVAMRVAKHLTDPANADTVRSLLDRFTIYIIPRPSPDASEKCFAKPRRRPAGNARKTDDDRDHEFGEDPPEDLNGDGVITMMRVADVTGPYRRHSNDPRVLVKADRTKGERGEFQLYVEGIDNDKDGKWNEDAGDGVAFNRNFTYNYPFFKPNAGRHQISEIETRGVADFLFNQTNIAAVLTFTPDDNLMHTWATGKNPSRIPTFIDSGDLVYVKQLADKYKKIHGGKDAPANVAGAGSFSEWAYFHYGRWSLATRGWWIPKVAVDGAVESESGNKSPDENDNEKPKKDDTRGQADINALRWLAANNIDGFVDWQEIDHPDFPGKKVEVGGFKPFVRDNPPASKLDDLGTKHFEFLKEVLSAMPRIAIHETDVKSLGAGLFRIKATVINEGFLPTSSEMGRRSRLVNKVQVALDLSEGAELLRGPIRVQLQPITGSGGQASHSWLVRLKDSKPTTTTIRTWAPAVGDHPLGHHKVEIELK